MKLKTIDDLFNKRIYRIPGYQRGYSWSNDAKNETGQLKDLWDDILNIKDSWHYTGLITLMTSKSEDIVLEDKWLMDFNFEQYYIVDGQQRLTTLLILIQVLIEKAKENGLRLSIMHSNEELEMKYLINSKNTTPSFLFGYANDNPSDKYFKKHILNIHDVIMDDSEESYYTENLRKAKEYFNKTLEDYLNKYSSEKVSTQALVEELFGKITNKLRFNEYILDKELNEYVVFETMNNRGKPLSELEKLKNRLMFLASKLQSNTEDEKELLRDNINKVWITIYKELGRNKEKPLDDETFIKNHWIMYFEYDRKVAKAYSRYLFDEMFTLKNVYENKLKYQDIYDYILSLQKSSKVWNELNNPEYLEYNSEIKSGLEKLHRVGFKSQFKPVIMASLIYYYNDVEFTLNLIDLLEEYAFKVFDITNKQSNTGDSKIYGYANKIHLNEACSETSEKNSAKLKVEILNELRSNISYYFNFDQFKVKIKELFDKQNGYYSWSGIRYFLYEYDQHLRNKNNIKEKYTQLDWRIFFEEQNSIEHIFPQSAEEKIIEHWAQFNHLTNEQKSRCCGSLGNLLGISNPKNSSLQNDSFDEKKDQGIKGENYSNRGYKFGSFSERMVAEYNEWIPETILDRGIDMLDFLWVKLGMGVNCPLTLSEKKELLGLDFLKEDEILKGKTISLETMEKKDIDLHENSEVFEVKDLESKLKNNLEELFPDGIYNNITEISIYREIQILSDIKAVTPIELLNQWGYTKLSNDKYPFDQEAAKKLINEFNVRQSELAEWLGYNEKCKNGRALLKQKLTAARGESGGWTRQMISSLEEDIIAMMISKKETVYQSDNIFIKIIGNGQDIGIVIIDDTNIKCIFNISGELKEKLEEHQYYQFNSFDIDVIRTGEVATYLGDRLFNTNMSIGSRCRELNMTKEQYFLYLGFDGVLNRNQATDSEIKDILSKYVASKNDISLPVDAPDYAALNNRANRAGYTLNELVAYYGYTRKDRDFEKEKKKRIEEYKKELGSYVVEENRIYLPTNTKLFRKLNAYSKNNDIALNDFISSLGYERVYE